MTKFIQSASAIFPFSITLCFIGLIGCGDGGDEITNVTNEISRMEKVKTFSELPKCTADNFGLIYYVSDSSKTYYCNEKKWMMLDGEDGSNGKDGKDGADGKNGEDGKNGINGRDGKDGEPPVLFDSAGNYIPGIGDTFTVEIINYGKVLEGIGECSSKRKGEVAHNDSICSWMYYICDANSWRTATPLEYDTYQWKDTTDGASKIGTVSKKLYVFDKTHWRAAGGAEIGLGACTEMRNGEVSKYTEVYFTCKDRQWAPSTTVEYDTYGIPCLENAAIESGRIHTLNKYVCDNGKFRFAKSLEVTANLGCTSYNDGASWKILNSNYVCDYDSTWKGHLDGANDNWITDRDESLWSYDFNNLNKGSFYDTRDGETYATIGIKSQIWMAENLRYNSGNSYCIFPTYPANFDSTYCLEHGRLYTWNDAKKACPEGWHLPDTTEWRTLYYATRLQWDEYGVPLPASTYRYILDMYEYIYESDGKTIKDSVEKFEITNQTIAAYEERLFWTSTPSNYTHNRFKTAWIASPPSRDGQQRVTDVFTITGVIDETYPEAYPVRCTKDAE